MRNPLQQLQCEQHKSKTSTSADRPIISGLAPLLFIVKPELWVTLFLFS